MTSWNLQAPGEVRQWRMEWDEQLDADEGIESSSWMVDPDEGDGTGPLADEDLIETGEKATVITVSGLQVGRSYQLRNTVTTSAGKTLVREITLRCRNRD